MARRARRRACRGHRPSRLQEQQRDAARRRRQRAAARRRHRLRPRSPHGRAGTATARHHRDRRSRRHAGLHGARASRRQGADAGGRHLRAWRRALRDDDWRRPVQSRYAAWLGAAAHLRTAAEDATRADSRVAGRLGPRDHALSRAASRGSLSGRDGRRRSARSPSRRSRQRWRRAGCRGVAPLACSSPPCSARSSLAVDDLAGDWRQRTPTATALRRRRASGRRGARLSQSGRPRRHAVALDRAGRDVDDGAGARQRQCAPFLARTSTG